MPCARRGWSNVEADTLECDFCKSRVILRIPASATRDEVTSLASKVAAKLDTAHKEECGWRGTVCPISVARFPRVSDDKLREDFHARRLSLASLASLPRVTSPASTALITGGAGGGTTTTAVNAIITPGGGPRGVTPPPPPPGTSRRVAALVEEARTSAGPAAEAVTLLALCGWETSAVKYVVEKKKEEEEEEEVGIVMKMKKTRSEGGKSGGGSRPAAAVSGAAAKQGEVVLSCQLCGARAAAWNFARGETPKPSTPTTGTGGVGGPGGEEVSRAGKVTPTTMTTISTPGPDTKKKVKATGAALMGAMGGAFGFGARAAGENVAVASTPQTTSTAAVGGVMNLSFSIAGGATPGSGASPTTATIFGGGGSGAKPSPPAFGPGAVRSSPFGVPQSPHAGGPTSGGGLFSRSISPGGGGGGVAPSPVPFGAAGGGARGGGSPGVTIPSFGSAAVTEEGGSKEGGDGAVAAKRKRDGNVGVGVAAGAVAGRAVARDIPALSTSGSFHPLRQHRSHCPWVAVHADVVSADQSSGNGTIGVRPGWVCTLDAVKPDTGEYLDEDEDDEDSRGAAGAAGETPSRAGGGAATPVDYSYAGARAAVAKYLSGA